MLQQIEINSILQKSETNLMLKKEKSSLNNNDIGVPPSSLRNRISSCNFHLQQIYQNYLRNSVIILTKTNGMTTMDVNQLLNMEHTDSVYKVLYNVDSHMGVLESEDGYVF